MKGRNEQGCLDSHGPLVAAVHQFLAGVRFPGDGAGGEGEGEQF